MKRILLIIAIAGMSFGCEAQDLGFYGTVADYPSINPNDSVPYLQLSKSDETVITLEKLLLYAQECYNDSTLKRVHYKDFDMSRGCGYETRTYMPPSICNGDTECCQESHYFVSNKYIHRKPTFEGFIEYLKSK